MPPNEVENVARGKSVGELFKSQKNLKVLLNFVLLEKYVLACNKIFFCVICSYKIILLLNNFTDFSQIYIHLLNCTANILYIRTSQH